jgi:phosphatidylserine/phosphatidylglycerophosphate/cardiolipin synthase-like enzyme
MNISPYAIQQLTPFITGNENPPVRSGPELVELFNEYGARDIYDELGLPDIGKKNGHRPSRKEYVAARLQALSGQVELRELLNRVLQDLHNKPEKLPILNALLIPEKYGVVEQNGNYFIQGGLIDNRPPVINEAHFQDIQHRILAALDAAQVSIWVVMAWFTNDTLFQKLVEKRRQGLDVKLAIFDDGVNKKHGVDVASLPHTLLKRGQRGGLMHDKFCVIDNQIVITGSYNWTSNAEFRNDENVTIEKDPEQATKFSVEFRRLTS